MLIKLNRNRLIVIYLFQKMFKCILAPLAELLLTCTINRLQRWSRRVCGDRCTKWDLCPWPQHGFYRWVTVTWNALQTVLPNPNILFYFCYIRTLPGPEEAEAGFISPSLGWYLLCAPWTYVYVIPNLYNRIYIHICFKRVGSICCLSISG